MITYNVYRNGEVIVTGIKERQFIDRDLEPNTTYTYQVSAQVDNSESDLSEVLEVQTDSIKVEKLTVSPKNTTLEVGKTKQINVTITPNEANQGVFFMSNNEEIATVSENGLVTAIKAGTATITVTSVDAKHKATTVVSVKESE